MARILQLKADNFRLYEQLELSPNQRYNLICGENAAGKTSLLELIYCLGRAKSFHGSNSSELAGVLGRYWRVSAKLSGSQLQPASRTTVTWAAQGTSIKSQHGEEVKAVELIRAHPVQVIDPGMHKLLQDGPSYRRNFLDWGVFHVEQQFLPVWRKHQRALKQRNRALRQNSSSREISAWDIELAESGEALQKLREQHLSALKPLIDRHLRAGLDAGDWSMELNPGWSSEHTYLQTLQKSLARDKRVGMTVEGAHRAELKIKLNQQAIKNHISRGQQKIMVAALVLSQSELIHQQTQNTPIVLVDDFTAELAPQYQKNFADMLKAYPGQVFITAFLPSAVLEDLPDLFMFHVEHGRVRQC
ncbi:MAG: DNA replication/repair protein RecF [Stenotrophobium sp.]